MEPEKFWNDIAEKYVQKPVEDLDAYHRKLELTKAGLKPGDIVLDVGCGTGSLALELAPLVCQVHAMDLSREMLRIAEQKAAEANMGNITFHEATLEHGLDFAGESFDVVCAYNILHLLDDRTRSLKRIFDLLRPGGQLIGMLPCYAADRDPAIRRLPKSDVRHVADLWLVSHPDLRENKRFRAARECVAQALVRRGPLFRGANPEGAERQIEPPTE